MMFLNLADGGGRTTWEKRHDKEVKNSHDIGMGRRRRAKQTATGHQAFG